MREIKFRGLRPDNAWEYGDLYTVPEKGWTLIRNRVDGERFFVRPETVGQFTGHCDVMGKEMYEGDIVSGYFEEDEWPAVVEWDEVTASFVLEGQCSQIRFDEMGGLEIEIVGNIHDNPELLENSR